VSRGAAEYAEGSVRGVIEALKREISETVTRSRRVRGDNFKKNLKVSQNLTAQLCVPRVSA
jgi:hypothetical protein